MIGLKNCLSGMDEPRIIPRPVQWQGADSMPKHYIRTAERMLHADTKSTRNLLFVMMIVFGIGGGLMTAFILAFAILGHWPELFLWALMPLSGTLIAVGALFYFFRSAKQCDDYYTSALQKRDFEWRTGKLDDIETVLTGYRHETEGPDTPEYTLYVYADGEQYKHFLLCETQLSTVKTGLNQIKVKKTGKMNLGDAVVIIHAGTQYLIMPQNDSFSEH